MDSELLVRMLREMLRVRRIDERMLAVQRQGGISFYGPATGQEAVAVGVGLALGPRDWVFPAFRESAIMLVRGFALRTWLAQCFGNQLDLLKGRQMPSHMAAREVMQASWGTCVATQLPHAVGAAWAMRLRGDDAVCVGFLGDGATSHQDFHASMNFAALGKVPCVLICQNNAWAISTPVARQSGSATIADKAAAYGMVSHRIDGNDVAVVYECASDAIAKARHGGGPTFIECLTYRIGPHSSSDDPSAYRDAADVEAWRKRDPIDRLAKRLRDEGLVDAQQIDAMIGEIDRELEAALRDAAQAPLPERDTMFEDVYAAPPWHLREQREQARAGDKRVVAPQDKEHSSGHGDKDL